MCGIAGIFYTDSSEIISEALLWRMTSVLHHRGPDEGSVYVDGPVGLGHRRLRVIDLEGGGQPIFNEDRSMAIVFNGEIYNFHELRKDLLRRGHRFETQSDTEVIIHAYEEYGGECVHYLRGMFAFAIWDGKKRELFLARDRMGIKPLFYYWDGRKFMFGSEIKAILEDPAVKREINLIALDDYLTYQYIPSPNTIFKGIRKLRPGHTLSVSNQRIIEHEYWDMQFEPQDGKSDSELVNCLLEKLHETIGLHLISDVPLGAFLSGGLDSSAVVAVMARLLKDPVYTASIGFREAEFDEIAYARLVAKAFKTSSYEKIMEAKDSNIVDILVWHFDEPLADPAMIPNYYVSQLARERMTVCLSGDGGDENFAGYTRFSKFVDDSADFPHSAEKLFFNTKSHLTREMKSLVYQEWLKKSLGDYDPFSIMKLYFDRARHLDPLSRVQYVETKTYLVDNILVKVDRTSMAHGLEVRVPFLDHVLMEYVASIPPRHKLHNGEGKYILKKAFRKVLPSQILDRPKMGFVVPLSRWFREDLKATFEERVFSRDAFTADLFNPNILKQWWTQHQAGERDYSRQLWAILVLECWGRKFEQVPDRRLH
jgi:asparagine synthase (glutamine-hydrolysing)